MVKSNRSERGTRKSVLENIFARLPPDGEMADAQELPRKRRTNVEKRLRRG
jgi:hypothetical protein